MLEACSEGVKRGWFAVVKSRYSARDDPSVGLVGDLKVSVTILGRIKVFVLGRSWPRSRGGSIADGEPSIPSDGLRLGPPLPVSAENKVRVFTNGSAFPRSFHGLSVFLIVPSSSSARNVASPPRSSPTARPGSGQSEESRLGSTDGADISPTHCTCTIGASMAMSCTSKPSTLNTMTLPACVPMAISVSEPSYTLPASADESPPKSTSLSARPLEVSGPLERMDREVAGPETCYVLRTLPPCSRSTSRHRPSCPMLTMRDL